MIMETVNYKNYSIEIYVDPDPINPVDDYDMLGEMICFHSRYNLGHYKSNFTKNKEEFIQYLNDNKNNIIYLPLYLYDHSGITMNTTGFSCSWDSGQVGIIYVTKDKVRNFFNCKNITSKIRQQVIDNLKSEVNTYDQYLRNEIYGYIVKDELDNEIDQVYGFFGSDHEKSGLLEYAQNVIDCELSKIGEQTELQLV